ncbi:MAG TPA: hypothetical protein VJ875_01080 [Pyrinomonadaceae bacterium]|nr:hypothetical protein [Pyrinomonadaceae bacterium]
MELYILGSRGWHTYTKEEYLRENRYREGAGYVLGDENDPDWSENLANKILSFQGAGEGIIQKLFGTGDYALRQENCGEAFCQAVTNTPGLPRNNGLLPAEHRAYILRLCNSFLTLNTNDPTESLAL